MKFIRSMPNTIPFTCPKCGAGIGDLKPVGRRQRNTSLPLFFHKCTKCGYEFEIKTKHCKEIIADTFAMEKLNQEFLAASKSLEVLI